MGPLLRYVARWEEVIFTGDLGELRKQGEVDAESSQSLQVASEPLRGGVENAVRAFRIVETIAECAVRAR